MIKSKNTLLSLFFIINFSACQQKNSNVFPEPIESSTITRKIDTLGNVQFYFKPISTKSFFVDFGDSTKSTFIDSTFSHQFENAGVYPIVIKNSKNKIIATDTLTIPFISKNLNLYQSKFTCDDNILSYEDNQNNTGCLPQAERGFRYGENNSISLYYIKNNPYVNVVFRIKSFSSNGSFIIDKSVEASHKNGNEAYQNLRGHCNLFLDNSTKRFTGDYLMEMIEINTKKRIILKGNFKNMKSEQFWNSYK
jgi:hypothetical protein